MMRFSTNTKIMIMIVTLFSVFLLVSSTLQASSQESFQIVGGGIVRMADVKRPVMLILGFPFPPPSSLKVEGELVPPPITISIEQYDKNRRIFLPTKDSLVPVSEPGGGNIKYFTQAINVIWSFTQAGISFETNDAEYISEKDGATINFTKNGVVLNSVKKVEKRK